MKRLLPMSSRLCLSCLICAVCLLSLCMVQPVAAEQVTASYANATLNEDTHWRGTVVVQGSLIVAPQATLRIEPGAVIRFMAANGSLQLPLLVVMGRIQCIGTAERPILFTSNLAISNKVTWGGVLLLSSEKRNQFDHCRIEGAETGLEARFSTVTAKALSIAKSTTGCMLRDTIATLVSPHISSCETGIEVHDSEVELRDATFAVNRRGLLLSRSSVVMSSAVVTGSTQQALLSDDCRIKFSSCEISNNALGAQISGGEGQIFLSRFVRNRDTALQLSKARLKISRCQISENLRDGLKLEDDRAAVWGNAISDNGGFNLINVGGGTVNARQNWWGSSIDAFIIAKLSGRATVNVFPWLTEKPTIFP